MPPKQLTTTAAALEPDARGARLVEQCVQFAERAGYTAMTILTDAIRLYGP